ncbi:MAG: hypothetical protein AAFQ51_12225 [Pseudomonadota bacterium]
MGDRAFIVFYNATDVSPTVYFHWNGHDVPEWLEELKQVMSGREGDLSYAAARFVGVANSHIDGNLSLGIWNTSTEIKRAILNDNDELLREYSHGDAGVILVNVADFSWRAVGGYLKASKQDETAA